MCAALRHLTTLWGRWESCSRGAAWEHDDMLPMLQTCAIHPAKTLIKADADDSEAGVLRDPSFSIPISLLVK